MPMTSKLIVLLVFFAVLVASAGGEVVFQKSAIAPIQGYHDGDDYSKAFWSLTVQGRNYRLTSDGDLVDVDHPTTRPLMLGQKGFWPFGARYLWDSAGIALLVGYRNDEDGYDILYIISPNFSKILKSVTIGDVGLSSFCIWNDLIVVSTVFSAVAFKRHDLAKIWDNSTFIGTDYHYDNEIDLEKNAKLKLTYQHTKNRSSVLGYSIIDPKNGRLIEQSN